MASARLNRAVCFPQSTPREPKVTHPLFSPKYRWGPLDVAVPNAVLHIGNPHRQDTPFLHMISNDINDLRDQHPYTTQ